MERRLEDGDILPNGAAAYANTGNHLTLAGDWRSELPLFFLTPRLGGMMQPEVFHGKANLQPGVQA